MVLTTIVGFVAVLCTGGMVCEYRTWRAEKQSLGGQRFIAHYTTNADNDPVVIEKVPAQDTMTSDEWNRWTAARGRHNKPICEYAWVVLDNGRIAEICDDYDFVWFGPRKPRPEQNQRALITC